MSLNVSNSSIEATLEAYQNGGQAIKDLYDSKVVQTADIIEDNPNETVTDEAEREQRGIGYVVAEKIGFGDFNAGDFKHLSFLATPIDATVVDNMRDNTTGDRVDGIEDPGGEGEDAVKNWILDHMPGGKFYDSNYSRVDNTDLLISEGAREKQDVLTDNDHALSVIEAGVDAGFDNEQIFMSVVFALNNGPRSDTTSVIDAALENLSPGERPDADAIFAQVEADYKPEVIFINPVREDVSAYFADESNYVSIKNGEDYFIEIAQESATEIVTEHEQELANEAQEEGERNRAGGTTPGNEPGTPGQNNSPGGTESGGNRNVNLGIQATQAIRDGDVEALTDLVQSDEGRQILQSKGFDPNLITDGLDLLDGDTSPSEVGSVIANAAGINISAQNIDDIANEVGGLLFDSNENVESTEESTSEVPPPVGDTNDFDVGDFNFDNFDFDEFRETLEPFLAENTEGGFDFDFDDVDIGVSDTDIDFSDADVDLSDPDFDFADASGNLFLNS